MLSMALRLWPGLPAFVECAGSAVSWCWARRGRGGSDCYMLGDTRKGGKDLKGRGGGDSWRVASGGLLMRISEGGYLLGVCGAGLSGCGGGRES